MVILRRIYKPVGGVIFGGKGPVVPFLLQNKEAGGAKINTGLIKVITGLNKVKEKVKTFQEVLSFFT